MDGKTIIISIILLGIILTSVLGLSSAIISTGTTETEYKNVINKYNYLDEMNEEAEPYISKIQGLNQSSSKLDLIGAITYGSYKVFIDSLRNVPILGTILLQLGEDLGIPSEIMVGFLSIIIISIVFWLATLFFKTIGLG